MKQTGRRVLSAMCGTADHVRFLGIVFAAFLFLSGHAAGEPQAAADAGLILYNGKIVTVDQGFRIAQAVAVKGDRIVAVGSDADVRKLAAPGAKMIDLKGKTVLPGLMDSHVHSTGAAMYEFDHEVPEMETMADVLAYVKSRAALLDDGQWIRVRQVFITRIREQRYPTREELDRAAPKNPVYFSTGPDASLNSLALKLSGIDKDFKITDGKPGRIERDPQTGEPTGIIRSAGRFVAAKSSEKSSTKADERRRLKELLADYNKVGITSIADRNASDGAVELYRELRDSKELTCRVFLSLAVDAQDSMEDIEARIRKAAASPLHEYNDMLWLRGIKTFLDGGMLTGSAYMLKPWGVSKVYSIDDPEYRGMRYIEPGKLFQIAKLALENDLQPTSHSVGSGAVEALIAAYEEVNNSIPIRDKRPCITHCNFMTQDAIDKMAKLGIVADLQPAWLERDGATLTKHFGDAGLDYFQPYKSLFEKGVVVGGGSDHMQKIGGLRSINPYNPFFGMWIALARQPRWTDQTLHPEQRITREQAIRLYTINNAHLMFQEKQKGSLEKGKLADLIVLDRDILTCPLDQVKDIQVEQTYLGGKLVYEVN
ncbi:MAG TPA: amidohydrolase [Bryobacterales bacterium]|nr:amidohydrolase [Bryobacterales bacterium]